MGRNTNKRLSDLESTVEDLKKYIVISEGVEVGEYIKNIERYIINYNIVGEGELSSQLEIDNLLMCRARLKKDFLEYCRRAVLQIEGINDWGLTKKLSNDPGVINDKWGTIQSYKDDRWYSDYEKDDPPDSLDDVHSKDKLELSICIFVHDKYQEKNRLNSYREILSSAIDIRNVASHREKEGDIKKRLKEKNVWDFFTEKDSDYDEKKNYEKVLKAMNCLIGGVRREFN